MIQGQPGLQNAFQDSQGYTVEILSQIPTPSPHKFFLDKAKHSHNPSTQEAETEGKS